MDSKDTYGTPQRSKSIALAYTSTSGSSAVIADCDAVCLQATTDCFIDIGSSPVATVNTSHFLGAYQPTYLRCQPGYKVAAIQLSAAGTLYISPF